MPHILILAALGLGAYAGLRLAKKVQGKAHQQTNKKQTNAQRAARDMGKLERDDATGVYRPSAHMD